MTLAITFENAEFSLEDNGIFGFLRTENLFNSFFLYGFFSGFVAMICYIVSITHFSPLVVMNCLLMESFFGQLISVFLNIDNMPGLRTWLGISLIILAINAI